MFISAICLHVQLLPVVLQIWTSVPTPKSAGTCWEWAQSQSFSLYTSMGKSFCTMGTKHQLLALLVELPPVPAWPVSTLAAGSFPHTLASTWKVKPARESMTLLFNKNQHLHPVLHSFSINADSFYFKWLQWHLLKMCHHVCSWFARVPKYQDVWWVYGAKKTAYHRTEKRESRVDLLYSSRRGHLGLCTKYAEKHGWVCTSWL